MFLFLTSTHSQKSARPESTAATLRRCTTDTHVACYFPATRERESVAEACCKLLCAPVGTSIASGRVPRPSTHRGDRHEDGCSDVSCSIVARGFRECRGARPVNATARRAATATGCSTANCSAAATDYGAGATDRTDTPAGARCAPAGTGRLIGTAESATTNVPPVAEVPICDATAVTAAAAVPVVSHSTCTAVQPSAVGALRNELQRRQ
jgi:hypothetical protein